MSKLFAALAAALAASVCSASTQALDEKAESPPAATAAASENERLEKGLQSLNWEQFKSVVSAIPKLKKDVDAYGPLGWQFVQANYKTYGWKKNIGKLDEDQKKRLAELILAAREGGRAHP